MILLLKVQYQMETLKQNFINLILKTLEIDPVKTAEYIATLQS